MMRMKLVWIYVALALLISWLPQFVAIRLWGLESEATRAVFVGVMWSPTLLAFAFLALVPSSRAGVRWRLGRPAYLPLGIAVETLIAFAMLGGFVATGLAASGWFVFHGRGVDISGGPWLLGSGSQSWLLFIMNVATTAVGYSVFGLIAATGEEFAWRGFLQGHLERRYDPRHATLVLAAIWWAWHLPGLLAGYNFPHYPVLGALLLFPLQMVGASLFFGWLTIRAGSFWPAALGHAAVNSVQQGVIDNLRLSVSMIWVDMVRTALILIVGGICWFALRPAGSDKVVPRLQR